MNSAIFHRRCIIICLICVAGLSSLSARLVTLQVDEAREYREEVEKAAAGATPDPHLAKRGSILDRSGRPISWSRKVVDLKIDKNVQRESKVDAEKIVATLAQPLGKTRDELRLLIGARYNKGGKEIREQVIQKNLSAKEAAELMKIAADEGISYSHDRAHRIAGHGDKDKRFGCLIFKDAYQRVYAYPTKAAHIRGYVGVDANDPEKRGQVGIEARMNTILAGRDGYVITRSGKSSDEIKPPKHGLDVQLTIDIGIQGILEEELDRALKESGAKKGAIIVMNPRTGEMLGMASRPVYNLETRENIDQNSFDFATQAIYEPGSTFKVVAIAAAMDEGLIQPDSVFDCKTMWRPIKVRDWKSFDDLTVEEILAKSSNVGAYKIALEVGPNTFFGYAKAFGFGAKTGIPMTGESAGWLINTGNPTDFSRVSFGYGVSVTPLQIACAYSALANGGKLMKPRLLKSIIGNNGVTHQRYEPVQIREVMSASTAAKMRQGLATVVATGGTGTRAAVEGFTVAGKTGTTQMLHPEGGYYNGLNDRESRYTVSFAGMMPADDPEFVCVVVVEDPKTGIPTLDADGNSVASPKVGGGSVAAPVFSRVATRVANELGLRPAQ